MFSSPQILSSTQITSNTGIILNTRTLVLYTWRNKFIPQSSHSNVAPSLRKKIIICFARKVWFYKSFGRTFREMETVICSFAKSCFVSCLGGVLGRMIWEGEKRRLLWTNVLHALE